MENINRIRRSNLRRLIQLNYAANQSLFARSIERSESYINRLLADPEGDHAKNLGEKLTRAMEVKLGLNSGWFDLEGATLPEWRAVERKQIHLDTVSSDDRSPVTVADDHSGIDLDPASLRQELLKVSAELAKLALQLQVLVSEPQDRY